jgi:MYXO-CTERM domain-containing protein
MTTGSGLQVGNQACEEDGEPLEWPEACLSYAIDVNGSDSMPFNEVEQAIDASFRTWQNANCGGDTPNLIFQPLNSSTCRRAEFRGNGQGGNVNTIAFRDPWEDQCGDDFARNAFAVTIVWHDTQTGRIFDADMMINDSLGPYAQCDPVSGCLRGTAGAPGPADLQAIVTHEVGHFIGIGHSDIADATMFPSSLRTDVSKRSLAQDDLEAVCTIYPPGNLDASCNAEVFNGLDLDCEDDGAPDCDGDPPMTGGGSGCSAASTSDARGSLVMAWLGLLALTASRRRSRRRDARS